MYSTMVTRQTRIVAMDSIAWKLTSLSPGANFIQSPQSNAHAIITIEIQLKIFILFLPLIGMLIVFYRKNSST